MRASAFVLPILVFGSFQGLQACSSDDTANPTGGDASTTDSGETLHDGGPIGDAAATDDASTSTDGGEFVNGIFNGTSVTFPFISFAGPSDAGIAGTAQLSAGVNNKTSAPYIFLQFDPVTGTSKCSLTNHDDIDYVVSIDPDAGVELEGYGAVFGLDGTECSIEITQFGAAAGDFVDGTFTATMAHKIDGGLAPSKVPASGSFHVKRTQ